MNEPSFSRLAAWIIEAGLAGRSETDALSGFCERALAAGLPLANALVIIDTLHPIHEGHATSWRRETGETTLIGYGRTSEGGEAAENWRRSVFHHMLETGRSEVRRRVTDAAIAEFPNLARDRDDGYTDAVAFVNRFAAEGVIGEMDCVYSRWLSDRPEGFSDAHLAALRSLMPSLALTMKCASLSRLAGSLAQTYLGRDAGRLVLAGRIARGVADRIEAVIWFSDLRGFTRITDTAKPDHIIPLLNDYAEAVVSAVHGKGGDVLKLIGDGVLAIFRAEEGRRACAAALDAAAAAVAEIAVLNVRRAGENLATTEMYLGLHIGEVFFGNIGSKERLDFTVVGPAVNETSRIAAMCRSAERTVLASAAFAAALGAERGRLVSVGRYALRGVRQPQELFTPDPEASGASNPSS